MTASPGPAPMLEFEAFGAAVGCSIVCGALSIAFPVLTMPTATLAALALAGWVSLARRRGGVSRSILTKETAGAFGVLAAAAVFFLLTPDAIVPFRAPLLSVGLVPLFAVERGFPIRRSDGRARR